MAARVQRIGLMLDQLWSFWPILLVVAMILAAAVLIKHLGGRTQTPYVSRERLVTKSELKFFHELRDAVDEDWEIFAMVRIADLLKVPRGINKRRSWLNKILSKHIDFVLCDTESLEIVMGIELDDRSHERADRIQRDQFVNSAFQDAEVPLLRIPTQKSYDPADLRRLIDKAL